LNEVCHYNVKNPHKNMWELKPEYRHYKVKAEEETKKDDDDDSSDDD
jgi:transcription initiation factor TFIIF subunit beta